MNTQICPVCLGSCIVDEGFYRRTSETWTNCGGTEKCRSCDGRGYVIIPTKLEQKDHDEEWKNARDAYSGVREDE